LEDYAAQFDALLVRLAQRRGLRAYLQGLLLPRDRNKTMTALAGAEPIVGAQHAAVQGLQWFLTESSWDHERVNQRRVQLLLDDPATAPHEQGTLVLDDTGDRKAGTKTAHVARQWLGSLGKTDNGIVAVTSLWADERVYWPVHAVPYPRRPGWPRASATRRFGPSRSWPPSWSAPPGRPRSGSARWWPTASTATTPASPRRSAEPAWPTC
jgi:SRSO17 transposase